eukprot:6202688-Pleurochrysis_carterae.AAC.1
MRTVLGALSRCAVYLSCDQPTCGMLPVLAAKACGRTRRPCQTRKADEAAGRAKASGRAEAGGRAEVCGRAEAAEKRFVFAAEACSQKAQVCGQSTHPNK